MWDVMVHGIDTVASERILADPRSSYGHIVCAAIDAIHDVVYDLWVLYALMYPEKVGFHKRDGCG